MRIITAGLLSLLAAPAAGSPLSFDWSAPLLPVTAIMAEASPFVMEGDWELIGQVAPCGLNTWTHEPEGAFTYQVGDGDVWFSDVIGEGAYLHFARFTDGEGEYVGMVMECEEAPLPAPPGVREEAGITRDSAAPNPPSAPVLPRVNYVLLRRAQVQPPPAPLPTPEPATLLLLGTGLLVLGWKAGGAH